MIQPTASYGLNAQPPLRLVSSTTTQTPRFGGNDAFEGIKARQTAVPEEAKLGASQRLGANLIRWYQTSPIFQKLRDWGLWPRCGYKLQGFSDLSCSEYTMAAIKKHGLIKGGLKGYGRILWCNPLTFKVAWLRKRFIAP